MGKSAAAGHGQDQRESAVVKEYGSGSLGRWGHLGTIFIIVFMDIVVIFNTILVGLNRSKNHPVFVYIVNIVTLIVIFATEMRGGGH